jgi:uncharacterized protein YjbI with pentapeptide repeats
MTDFRLARKHIGKAICLFVLLSSIYGIYPSLKELPASNWIQLITWLSSSATALLIAGIGYKNYQALQQKNATDAETAKQNYQALIDKNTADRFSKAIEQLGNIDSIHVRLGGIFALEQIANTEDKYYWQIMEILTSYVRERSPSSHDQEKISEDIQAVMKVLSRRRFSYQHGEDVRLDLNDTNLRNLRLQPNAKLQGANLRNTCLTDAFMHSANLAGADLRDSVLERVELRHADLQEARLWNVDMQGAFLDHAILIKTDLRNGNLSNAYLEKANLEQANLHKVTLCHTEMDEANLSRARLNRANLEHAYLGNANLHGANLQLANLQNTSFNGADCQWANFTGANFKETDFNHAILASADIPDGNNAIGLPPEELGVVSYHQAVLPSYLRQANSPDQPSP